jgi:hypothetical protein
MKELIQGLCFILCLVCFVGCLASSVWNIMHFFTPENPFYVEPVIKGCMDNFFNWILAMCLTFLVFENE